MRAGVGIRRAVACAALLCLAVPALTQPTDTSVKAAFLPRFARYVTWPPAAMPRGADPFQLCVIGSDPFGPMLDDAAGSQLVDDAHVTGRCCGSIPAASRSCDIQVR